MEIKPKHRLDHTKIETIIKYCIGETEAAGDKVKEELEMFEA